MTFPQFIRGAFGRLKWFHLNEIFSELHRLKETQERLRREVQAVKLRQWFFGQITGHVGFDALHDEGTIASIGTASTTIQWLYSWRKVAWNAKGRLWVPIMRPVLSTTTDSRAPVQTVTFVEDNSTVNGDPFALGAINGVEAPNLVYDGTPGNAAGMVGPGVDMDNTSYVNCSIELKPIMNGVVVPMFTLHGSLTLDQITQGRSPIAFMFAIGNAHDKINPGVAA